MRVIHSVPYWLPQTEVWLYDEVRFLPADVETHVVCEVTANLDQFHHPRLHCLRDEPIWKYVPDLAMRKLRLRRHLSYLVQWVRRTRANVVHSHFGHTGWADTGAVKRSGARHVVTFYGIDVNHLPVSNPQWRIRYRELFAHVTIVLCEGTHMAERVVELGCPREKVKVHHLGVDVTTIPFKPRTWRTGTPLRVLMAASFREKKGFPYGIRALGKLREHVDVELTLIGDAHGSSATEREKRRIVQAIAESGLEPHTRMLGYVPIDRFREEAASHHVFLSPSVTAVDGDTEGGAPVGIIEFAASGMPVVTTTHCDIPGIITDGETGWAAPERDIDGLVQRLQWLVGHPTEWEPVLRAARTHVENEFDARRQGERLATIYRELA